ncbi:MAG: hypothetical protein ACE37H_18170 [Phycisphaeraceae bacterium]
MPQALAPYLDLAKDAGLALTDPAYAYGLLVAAAPLFTVAGLLVLIGLIATHGKSHGTRFSALALFAFAAAAAASAYLLRPEQSAGTMLAMLLAWSWAPPLAAAAAIVATMAKNPKPRALGLAGATLVALCATVFGGMLSVANARVMQPDRLTWLDAPPLEVVLPEQAEGPKQQKMLDVLDTAHRKE